jgi:hypothetical protein
MRPASAIASQLNKSVRSAPSIRQSRSAHRPPRMQQAGLETSPLRTTVNCKPRTRPAAVLSHRRKRSHVIRIGRCRRRGKSQEHSGRSRPSRRTESSACRARLNGPCRGAPAAAVRCRRVPFGHLSLLASSRGPPRRCTTALTLPPGATAITAPPPVARLAESHCLGRAPHPAFQTPHEGRTATLRPRCRRWLRAAPDGSRRTWR